MFYLLILYSINIILSNNRMNKKEKYMYFFIYLCLLKIMFILFFSFY